MTINASTNTAEAVRTDRGPVVHWRGQHGTVSLSSALPVHTDDMAEAVPVDAIVAIVKGPATDRHELGSADSTSLPRSFDEQALPSTGLSHPAPTPMRFLTVPPIRKAPYTFRLLQQWEGTVTEITGGDFTAELRDLTDPDNYREEAIFELDEVSPGDQPLLALGAVFRWSIGYKTSAAGQRERVSQIRFVRIPDWRKSAVEEIKRQATRLQKRFPLT